MKQQHKVRGFPTVLILSPGGDLVQTTGYQSGGAERYVEHLRSFIDPHTVLAVRRVAPERRVSSLSATGFTNRNFLTAAVTM
jgi:hypothetical protein